jgi:intracellular septation protein
MKFLFDLFPVILFFAAFKVTASIYVATAVAIVSTFVQVGWMFFRHRKVDNMLWVSLFVIVIFGGATLLLHDETFIKWKPTVLYWLFATTLFIAEYGFHKNLIKSMMEKQMSLPAAVWLRLMQSWAGFFIFMGALNLYVAFNFPTDTWVNFKLFGGMGLMLIFVVIQGLMLAKHVNDGETK